MSRRTQDSEEDVRRAEPDSASTRRAGQGDNGTEQEISLLAVARVLLRHRRKVLLCPLFGAVFLFMLAFFFTSKTWTSTVVFTPEAGEQSRPRLQGLASQFGVNIPTGEGQQSSEFYVELLESREILSQVVLTNYSSATYDGADSSHWSSDRVWETEAAVVDNTHESEIRSQRTHQGGQPPQPGESTLLDLYDIDTEDSAKAVAKAVRKLRSDLSTQIDLESGLVTASVTMRNPLIAAAVSGRLLSMLNEFNLSVRQSQASAKRRFLEDRVGKAHSELLAAEDSLERFLETNRRYENSPRLVFQRQRLQRRVDLHQQIYSSLAQSLEEAKIEEVRNTPVITVVQSPEPPAIPDSRGIISKTLFGIFLGGFVGIVWAFASEYINAARELDPEEYDELAVLWEQTQQEVRSKWNRVLRFWSDRGWQWDRQQE